MTLAKTRDPTLAERVGALGEITNKLDLATKIADLAIDIAEQAQGGPASDTERLREMLLKLKGEKR